MRELFGVMNSDAVSKNNLRLATGSLHTAVAEYWERGLPMCISHDAHRPIGWAIPVGVHLEPGLGRTVAVSLLAETDEDSHNLDKAYRRRVYERIREATAEHEAQLRTLLGTSVQGDEQAAYLLTPALVGKDLAKRHFPDVFALEDKDGLVPLAALAPNRPGVYRRGPLVLFAHPFFRRSLSRLNNLNDELLSELEALAKTDGVTVKIRLDPDAVGLAEQVHEPIEMQYWRGPLFNDNLSGISPGVTQHEADDRQRFFSLVCRTEFWWQSRRNDALNRQEHIFEAEELREHYSFGSSELLYGCRYVHSIIVESQNRIEHLDGAIREYTDEALILRLDEDIAHAGRHTQYTKYWRADGVLRLATWKTLVYHHFRDNSLVGEYLGMPSAAEAPVTQEQPSAPPVSPAMRRVVPHTGASDGLRVALTYQQFVEEPLASERQLARLGYISGGGEKIRFFDIEFLDFVKMVRRAGLSLDVPSGIRHVAFEDLYHSFPLIRHRTHRAVSDSLTVLRRLITRWQKPERVLAVTVSAVTDNMELRLSLLGGCTSLVRWLETFTFPPDNTTAECTRWVEQVSEYLNDLSPVNDHPPLASVLKRDGIFFLPRVEVPREWITGVTGQCRPSVDAAQINRDDPAIGQLLLGEQIAPAFAAFIRSSCSSCGMDYHECSCSKYTDEDVTEVVEDFDPLYCFWTDRPA